MNPISDGANALKIENEIKSESTSESIKDTNNLYHEELLKNQGIENIIENISDEKEDSFSKEVLGNSETKNEIVSDLKEFGVDTNEPDLFNSDNQDSSSEDLLGSFSDEENDDDLEIPAFLRRQKN